MTLAWLNRCAFVPVAYSDSDDFEVNGSAPVTGFYAPAECLNPVVVDTATYHYFAQSADKTQHEEGDAVWDDGAGKLLRSSGTVRNSSNSGALVNFSAAPIVTMGGPVADDIQAPSASGRWELIAETVITSPTPQFTHPIADAARYLRITVEVMDAVVDSGSPFVGMTLADQSVAAPDGLTYIDHPYSNYPDFAVSDFGFDLTTGRGFSAGTFNRSNLYDGGSPTLPLTDLVMTFSGMNGNQGEDADLYDITAGRFRTFGLRA